MIEIEDRIARLRKGHGIHLFLPRQGEGRSIEAELARPATPGDEDDAVAVRFGWIIDVHHQAESRVHAVRDVPVYSKWRIRRCRIDK